MGRVLCIISSTDGQNTETCLSSSTQALHDIMLLVMYSDVLLAQHTTYLMHHVLCSAVTSLLENKLLT